MPKIEIFADPCGDWMEIKYNGETIFSDHESNLQAWRLTDLLNTLGFDAEHIEKEFD